MYAEGNYRRGIEFYGTFEMFSVGSFFHIFLAYLVKKLYNNRRAKLIVQKKR